MSASSVFLDIKQLYEIREVSWVCLDNDEGLIIIRLVINAVQLDIYRYISVKGKVVVCKTMNKGYIWSSY